MNLQKNWQQRQKEQKKTTLCVQHQEEAKESNRVEEICEQVEQFAFKY